MSFEMLHIHTVYKYSQVDIIWINTHVEIGMWTHSTKLTTSGMQICDLIEPSESKLEKWNI